jgi:KDO2-lipid IV(A) lauroyltransferase
MKLLKKTKRNAVYTLTRWAFFGFNVIPRRLAVFLGACLGLAAWSVLPRDRHKIQRHLSLVFGSSLSTSDKHNIGRDFFVNTGKNLADVFRFKKHFTTEIKPLITVEGLEEFDAAFKNEKGVLGITGHIGNFELLAVYLASLGYRTAVIGRELYDPRLNKLLVENRESSGLINFATTESPRQLLRWLKSGGGIGVLVDTDSTRVRGEFIPFFGRLANTPIGQSLLGLRAGSSFFAMACLRTDDNRYRIVIKPQVRVELTGNVEEDAYRMTLEYTNVLEKIIAENRSQWIWLHNRWHTSPKNMI